MTYRIILQTSEGEQRMIQDYDNNKEFLVPDEEHGICMIEAKNSEMSDEVVEVVIAY